VLHDVSEIAGKAKVVGELIGCGYREVVVQPVVGQIYGRNLGSVGSHGAEVIVSETAYEVALGILHGGVLSLQALPFHAGAIVEVELLGDIPVVGEVECQLVLAAFIIF